MPIRPRGRMRGIHGSVLYGVHCLEFGPGAERAVESTRATESLRRLFGFLESHLGGCQNYGPFWGPYYNTAPII